MSAFTCVLIGNDSLTVQCAAMLLEAGHGLRAVVTRNAEVHAWAEAEGLPVLAPGPDLAARIGAARIGAEPFDWLLSIANLDIIAPEVLDLAGQGAVNFHDGPLPAYAGLNAPVWAILNGEARHAITWHLIGGGVDRGDILDQRQFDIAPGETALTLNLKCYAAAIESFGDVIARLAQGNVVGTPQDPAGRSYFARSKRPAAAARLDFTGPVAAVATLVQGLDHGDYRNPLACPKVVVGDRVFLVGAAAKFDGLGAPGTVLSVSGGTVALACADGAVALSQWRDPAGNSVDPADILRPGQVLATADAAEAAALTAAIAATAGAEDHWRDRLSALVPPALTLPGGDAAQDIALPAGIDADTARAGFAALVARLGGGGAVDLALGLPVSAAGYVSDWVPVRFDPLGDFAAAAAAFAGELDAARARGGFAADLPARTPGLAGLCAPSAGVTLAPGPIPGVALSLSGQGPLTLHGHADWVPLFAARLETLLHAVAAAPATPVTDLPVLPDDERDLVLNRWNATEAPLAETCIHHQFEAQVARSPDATALVFEGERLSYGDLNTRANCVAHVLRDMGAGPGSFVGLHLRRSAEMLIGALAIQKAGAAYVPLDPAYPAERLALYLNDSDAQIVLTDAALAPGLPPHAAQVLEIDTDPRIASAPGANPDSGVTPTDLAYLIYTSGSTGRPKGVMVEHRNVANFFTGMDARIATDPPGVWLAVTSLSFDISVLELFWTLARGFAVVVSGEDSRALVSDGRIGMTGRGMDFSLYYWGNDDGVGRDKYRSLLEGAKFADDHGFCAIWTPERHFHAFGGPYPNPAVTGAAVAAVTRNLAVRAGSCVAPLHHPARIAEDWAVIDNLTNGRAGLGIASGWQPHDFVLRPENAPPNNKRAMFEAIETLRALWSGQEVAFPTADGGTHKVLTQPRPVSKTLPIWVTTAGNPDTWREAGSIGANVLTHLLGQSIAEVAGKIAIYHEALRTAGHDPADFKVTLMLHSFVAADREVARDTARGPMKDYMRAAAGLIKQFAWVFPAFKKPKGVDNPAQIDLGILSPEELDEILEFAFLRYFEDSGLFGTVEDCLERVEQLKRIGVDEVACLIDYGIPVDQVMAGLRPLAEVLRRSNLPDELADDDFSIAAQIVRHRVTHLQCTPSMARMLVGNDEARIALGRVPNLMIGGEALPGALVAEMKSAGAQRIENMYGPTETTIWSTTGLAEPGAGVTSIGTPVANTQVYVLDADRQPLPVGVPGELWIGGAGVARGYWQRADLTAEMFVPNPFAPGRMYRTGDLARWRPDGSLDYLGRTDHQIKLRGYRIELGEIEAAMDAHPGVTQAVVIAREDVPGLVQLVGYMTTSAPVDEPGLRARLATILPEHMIPAKFMALDAFPLTPNRKVDRKALPVPVARTSAGAAGPQGGSAGKIAAIWSKILGVQGIGPRDSFFDLGGHSLLAVLAHREIREALAVPMLSITDIFRFPTLAALAARVDDLAGNGGPKTAPQDGPERAASRADAMARRRAMRATRLTGG